MSTSLTFPRRNFPPSFGVLLVAAFPRIQFLRKKYETKIMKKEIFMDPTLCYIYYLAVPSKGFSKMKLKRLSTLHLNFI
jgi:hypothetical protein